LPTVNCPADDDVCIDADPITLSGATPTGGTYSGTGVSGGEFDPATAGIGTHTITYEYTDTYSCVSSCTFNITVAAGPTVDAGADASICESGYQLDGSSTTTVATLWATFGDGTFSNPNIEDPFYTPGPNDLTAGEVQLTFVGYATSPCTGLVSDNIWLYIVQDLPTVSAGPDGTGCETGGYALDDAIASDYSDLLWVKFNADGTFDLRAR